MRSLLHAEIVDFGLLLASRLNHLWPEREPRQKSDRKKHDHRQRDQPGRLAAAYGVFRAYADRGNERREDAKHKYDIDKVVGRTHDIHLKVSLQATNLRVQ